MEARGRREGGSGGMGVRRVRGLELYYLATPLFAALDLVAGLAVRAAFTGLPQLRFAWYALCLGCYAVIRMRPSWAAPVALVESSLNLLLLLASMLGSVYGAVALVGAAEGVPVAVAVPGRVQLAGALLAGCVWIRVFRRAEGALADQFGIPRALR